MATLNEIAYNIRNTVSGGIASDDTDISLRQIKFMVHYHRANLLLQYTDNGKKVSNSCFQVDVINPKLNGVTLNDFVVEELDTFISTASIGPTLYLSVPVPTTPFNSLLTNSIQLPAWAKYPLP